MIVIPRERGGWWHHYVCPTHGVELSHLGLLGGSFPAAGVPCKYGCRWDTPEIRGAWTVLAHQACAAAATAETLKEYEELYLTMPASHDGAEPWMLRGRLFHQALTEAIWAVRISQAAHRLGNPVPRLLEALASAAAQARDTLVAQGNFRSNFVAWLNAAGWACSGDFSFVDSQQRHVLEATGEDGWEWEGSTYYHDFVLRAYELTLSDPPPEVAERLRAMREVSTLFRGAALHDSPFTLTGGAAIPFEGMPEQLAHGTSRLFPSVGYAVIENAGIKAILDFGPHGGSHGHRDKLALQLYPWQPDPGQVPYGQKAWRDYYASTKAHPTFRIDELEQAECTGYQIDAHTFACDDAYPGVRARRRVTPIEGGLLDELTVTCDRPRRVTSQLRPAVPVQVTGQTMRWDNSLESRHSATVDGAFMVKTGPGPAADPQRTIAQIDWTVLDTTEVTFRSEYRCCA